MTHDLPAGRGCSRRTWLEVAGAALAAIPFARVRAMASEPGRTAPGRSRLILLGTAGGPTPKVDRSAPASALVVDGRVYVVDCGNGVARQMVLAGLDLGAIRHVFITHHHSDHNADYGTLLLLAWATNLRSRVASWGPPPLARMTELFLEFQARDIAVRQEDEGRPPLAPLIVPHEIAGPGAVMADDLVRVTAAVVEHPLVTPAFAYRFDCPDRSIVFSGDTRPSEQLVALARGADVLVHEVIDPEAIGAVLRSEAQAARLRQHLLAAHTSVHDVGRVATEAGVKTLVLNHFVPGVPKIPDRVWYDAVRPHFRGRIVVGRDLMEI